MKQQAEMTPNEMSLPMEPEEVYYQDLQFREIHYANGQDLGFIPENIRVETDEAHNLWSIFIRIPLPSIVKNGLQKKPEYVIKVGGYARYNNDRNNINNADIKITTPFNWNNGTMSVTLHAEPPKTDSPWDALKNAPNLASDSENRFSVTNDSRFLYLTATLPFVFENQKLWKIYLIFNFDPKHCVGKRSLNHDNPYLEARITAEGTKADNWVQQVPMDSRERTNSFICVYKAGITHPNYQYVAKRPDVWYSKYGYLLEYVVKGKGNITYQDKTYPVSEGDFFIINRSVLCTQSVGTTEPYEKVWVNVMGRLLNAMLYSYSIEQPVYIIHCPNVYPLFVKMLKILKTCTPDTVPYSYSDLSECITKIFWEMGKAQTLLDSRSSREAINFHMVTDFIHDNLTSEHLTADYIANSLYISRITLYRLFKNNIAISPKEYIDKAKVEYAKYMLLQSDEKINAIAGQLHFKSIKNFNKLFKLYTGCTPSAWKKENKT